MCVDKGGNISSVVVISDQISSDLANLKKKTNHSGLKPSKVFHLIPKN